jgi:membrane-associated phospholipid phosphatase
MIGAFFQKNASFLIPAILLLSVGIVFLFLFPKDIIHLTQNAWYHPTLDPVFKYGTHLGDGLIFVGAILGLSVSSLKRGLAMLYAALLTLVLVGVLKQLVFSEEVRPVKFFEGVQELRLVEGVENHHSNSFPSGHTTAAFACYGLLAFFVRQRALKGLLLIFPLWVGYSRIYLSQHFLEDVVAGGFLGLGIALLSYYLMHLNKKQWADKGLLNRKG